MLLDLNSATNCFQTILYVRVCFSQLLIRAEGNGGIFCSGGDDCFKTSLLLCTGLFWLLHLSNVGAFFFWKHLSSLFFFSGYEEISNCPSFENKNLTVSFLLSQKARDGCTDKYKQNTLYNISAQSGCEQKQFLTLPVCSHKAVFASSAA